MLKESMLAPRSISIALPGSLTLFSQMQHALTTKQIGHRISLKKSVHQAINYFKWIIQDISSCPTRIAELVPLLLSAEAHQVRVVFGSHHRTYLQDVDLIIVPSSGALNGPRTSLTAQSPTPTPIVQSPTLNSNSQVAYQTQKPLSNALTSVKEPDRDIQSQRFGVVRQLDVQHYQRMSLQNNPIHYPWWVEGTRGQMAVHYCISKEW